MSGNELPKVIDKSQDDIDAAINTIAASNMPSATKDFAISCIKLAVWLPKALLEQKIRLSNLRKLIFGRGKSNSAKKNKKHNNLDTEKPEPESPNAENAEKIPEPPTSNESLSMDDNTQPQGHGRLAHTAYTNAIEHTLTISGLKVGDLCPEDCGGKLYEYQPGVLVRVKGQNLADVHKYWIEKLRCATCGYLLSADIPADIGEEKYDHTFKSLLVLQKYYVAVPFYRQAYFQSLLDMPLPASTQWKLIEEVFGAAIYVFNALEKHADNGDIIHNDDSHVKITDVIHLNQKEPKKERKGTFTSGILSRKNGRDSVLFYNGTQHAGENLNQLLEKRDPHQGPVIQMCDALNQNIPRKFETILCNCLSHGLRKFDELKEFYPEPCLHIIEHIAKVYEHEEDAKEMDSGERLNHHQRNSEPIMRALHEFITGQLDSKSVEPNDSLGNAMRYMLKHWHKLTQFLRVAGAPIDNNVLERALKIPIRGRRTWLFYKTKYGALIGGVLTSVIATCEKAGVNPLTYLTALQQHKNQVVKEPEAWLPWCYQDNFILSAA